MKEYERINQNKINLVTQGLDLTEKEQRSLDWLCGYGGDTLDNLCAVIEKAKACNEETYCISTKCEIDKDGVVDVVSSIQGSVEEVENCLTAVMTLLLKKPERGTPIILTSLILAFKKTCGTELLIGLLEVTAEGLKLDETMSLKEIIS